MVKILLLNWTKKVRKMKKVKLSTISLNAETLGAQSPDYYNFRKYGLGTQTNDVLPLVADYNADMNVGFYSGTPTSINAPSAQSYTLLHIKRGPGYIHQLAFDTTNNGFIYYRVSYSYVWTNWKKITMV